MNLFSLSFVGQEPKETAVSVHTTVCADAPYIPRYPYQAQLLPTLAPPLFLYMSKAKAQEKQRKSHAWHQDATKLVKSMCDILGIAKTQHGNLERPPTIVRSPNFTVNHASKRTQAHSVHG